MCDDDISVCVSLCVCACFILVGILRALGKSKDQSRICCRFDRRISRFVGQSSSGWGQLSRAGVPQKCAADSWASFRRVYFFSFFLFFFRILFCFSVWGLGQFSLLFAAFWEDVFFHSMDWFKGKFPGKPHISWENPYVSCRFYLKPIQ